MSDAKTLPIAAAVRPHGGIEKGLHRVLDVDFDVGRNRTQAGRSTENLVWVRKLALNLLRLEPTRKHGIKATRLQAGWDHDYLLRVLGAMERYALQSPLGDAPISAPPPR